MKFNKSRSATLDKHVFVVSQYHRVAWLPLIMAAWQQLRLLRHRDMLLGSLLRAFERDQLECRVLQSKVGMSMKPPVKNGLPFAPGRDEISHIHRHMVYIHYHNICIYFSNLGPSNQFSRSPRSICLNSVTAGMDFKFWAIG